MNSLTPIVLAALIGIMAGSPSTAWAQRATDGLLGPDVFQELLETPQIEDPEEAVPAEDWSYGPLYESGWPARTLLGVEVSGSGGEAIGEVSDLLVEPEGQLIGIVVEMARTLQIGATQFFVPWSEVEVTTPRRRVSIPVREESLDELDPADLQETVDAAVARTGAWSARTLIEGTVSAPGVASYGTVLDLIFSPDGELTAVLVDPEDVVDEGGPYAFPYLEDAYDAVYNAYDVPYTPQESAQLEPFDYGALGAAE